MASGSRGQCSLFATCLAVSLYLSYPHLKAGWYWESGGKIPLSRVWKALKKLAAEGIFDEVGTPTFAIDVISQHDMAFTLRSLANPAYAELMVTNMAVRTHASRRLQPSCPPLWRPMSEDDLVDSRTSWAGVRVRAGPVVRCLGWPLWVPRWQGGE